MCFQNSRLISWMYLSFCDTGYKHGGCDIVLKYELSFKTSHREIGPLLELWKNLLILQMLWVSSLLLHVIQDRSYLLLLECYCRSWSLHCCSQRGFEDWNLKLYSDILQRLSLYMNVICLETNWTMYIFPLRQINSNSNVHFVISIDDRIA